MNEAVYGAWLRNGAGSFDPTAFSKALAPDAMPLIPDFHRERKVKTIDQELSDTARDTFKATDLDDFKSSRAEKEMNGAVELGAVAASFFGPGAALGAGLLKAGYPYIRDEIARELQARGIPLASVRARAILGYANATQEIRNDTQIGKVLQPYYSQLTTNDPKVNSNTKDPVRLAKVDLQSYAAQKSSESALLETKGIREDIKTLQSGIVRIKAEIGRARQAGRSLGSERFVSAKASEGL